MKKITKPFENEYALYYENYVSKPDPTRSVLDQLKENAKLIEQFCKSYTDASLSLPYAEGKWSVKDILMHQIDFERVFLYRAMRFARKDLSPLPFFDENAFAEVAQASSMPINKLLKEYKATRQASLAFFANQTAASLKRIGYASQTAMSVRACAWVLCGHELHHWHVMQERYPVVLVKS